MKKFGIVAVLSFILFLLAILNTSTQAAPLPKAVFQGTSFSAGEVDQGKPVVHAFTVLNQGDAPLKIERVRPG